MGAINDFVTAFGHNRNQYLAVEKEVEGRCKEALRPGIEFLWQSRVKAPDSLEKKLRGRSKDYDDEFENIADVKDLVAGRIILARWLDFQHVERTVKEIFTCISQAQHPKHAHNAINFNTRFRGYDGLHFYVKRKGNTDEQSCNPVIEIQVMSAFMWAFSTLQHDVEYKRSQGELDEDQTLCLDSLKGAANLGEIFLQIYDKRFFNVAKLSSTHSDTKPDLQNRIQTVMTEVKFDEKDNQCLRDLRLTDPRHDKVRIEAKGDQLLEGSCSWVLQDPAFVTWWNRDDSRLLLIHGNPGKGKKMMMISLISELSNRLKDQPGSNVLAYFFCQNTNSDLNTTVSVLRGLIYHLVDHEKQLIRYIRKCYDKAGRRIFEDENALYALQAVLVDILRDQSLGNVYFLVDALDECDATVHDLLRWICSTDSQLSSRTKWLTTSRNQPDLQERLGRSHQLHISLELNSSHIDKAVASFIDYKAKELADLKSYSAELQLSIRKSLLEKAEDTFLWVALVCKELIDVRPERAEIWLGKTPAGLAPLYQRMLDQVLRQKDEDDVKLCRWILRTVVLAFRPLYLEEIKVLTEGLGDVQDLAGHCGSFITIREGVAYLVHQSAKDFLADESRTSIFHLGLNHAHSLMVRSCLEVMSHNLRRDISDLKMPGIYLGDFDKTKTKTLIPQYACLYWVDHLHHVNPNDRKDLISYGYRSIYRFLKRHFLHWLEELGLMSKVSEAVLTISSLCSTPWLRRNPDLFAFLNDARRFILEFRHIIEMAPLQVYHSALVFSPKTSIIKHLFLHEMPIWIETRPVVEEAWTASLQILEGHSSFIRAIAFSPDGRLLASASGDCTVRLWDSATGASQGTLGIHPSGVSTVRFSPNGLLASASYGQISIWDPISGISLGKLQDQLPFHETLKLSPKGQLLASVSKNHTVQTWDPTIGTLQRTFRDHSAGIRAIEFAPSGQILASASDDKTIKIWDPVTEGLLITLRGHADSVMAIAFSPSNGQLLASGSADNTVRLWNLATGASQSSLEGHSDDVGAVTFSPDGHLLASASDDSTIKLWSSVGALQYTLRGHSSPVRMIALSPNSRILASRSYDRIIRLWDPTTGDIQGTLDCYSSSICNIVFSPNSRLLASASNDDTIRVWDSTINVSQGMLEGHSQSVTAITLCPERQFLATVSEDSTVKVWNFDGVLQGMFKSHTNYAGAIAFCPNDRPLTFPSSDPNLKLWNVVTETCSILHSSMAHQVVFSPNGSLLASALQNLAIEIWDLDIGKSRGALYGHTTFINLIIFSPDSRLLASADTHTIEVWNPVTMACQGNIIGQFALVSAIAFSSDGRRIASTHYDSTITIWNVQSRTPVQRIEYGHDQNLLNVLAQFNSNSSRQLSFNLDGSQLELDGRRLQISSSSSSSSLSSSRALPPKQVVLDDSYAIDFNYEWVTYKGHRVLWLPPSRRLSTYAIHDNTVVLGSKSGRVTLLRFSKTHHPV